jgi:hypothetical protein
MNNDDCGIESVTSVFWIGEVMDEEIERMHACHTSSGSTFFLLYFSLASNPNHTFAFHQLFIFYSNQLVFIL